MTTPSALQSALSPGEAARSLGVSRKRVDELLRNGRLTYTTVPFGRRTMRLVDAEAIETYRRERDARADR